MSDEKTTMTKTAVAKEAKPMRKERNSITGTRTKLQLTGEEPGFHYAWINEDNVGTAEDAGYEFVSHAIKVGNRHIDVSQMQGSKVSRNVGNQVIAYLMRVPQEWYDADMAEEQRLKVDAAEAQVFVDSNSNGLHGTLKTGRDAWNEPLPDIFKGK
jgi:hypothetical protein